MTGPIDTAYVEVRADTSKVGTDIARGVNTEMARAGKTITNAVAKPVEDGAKRATSAFTTMGNTVSSAFKPAINQVSNFKAGFTDTQAAASAFTGTMGSLGGKARTAFDPGIKAVQNFSAGFKSTDAAASAFTGRMGTVGGVVSSAFNTGKSVMRDFGSIGSSVAGKVSSAFSTSAATAQARFTKAFATMRSNALLLGASLGVGGIGALIGSGISRISDIEQTTKSLEVMTGSATKAKKVMNDLLGFAKTTPFAFPDISEIGRNLISFGIDTQQVIPIMKALGDAASASGRGTEGLKSLGTIIGQIASKGKLQGDELLQLAENGIPALKILANTAGVSTQEMSTRISKGSVDSQFAINALVNGIENGTKGIAGSTARMGGIMASQKDTIVGTMDSFKSSVSSTMATLLTPAIPAFRASVNFIGEQFKRLPAAFDTIKKTLTDLGFIDAFKNIFVSIGQIIKNVWPAVQQFGKVFLTTFGAGLLVGLRALGAGLQWFAGIIKTLQPVLMPLATVLGAVWGAMGLLKVASMAVGGAMLIWKGIMIAFGPIMKIFTALQWALNIAMNANPISLIIIAIAALVAAFVILWNKSAAFRQFWIDLWNNIVGIVKVVINAIVVAWNAVVAALTVAWNAIKTAAMAVWNAIGTAINAVWTSFIKPIFDAFSAAFSAIGAAAQWLWTTILQPVFNFIGQAAVILGKIVLGLVLVPLVAFWQYVLAPAAMWLWHNVFEPVWNGISAAISFAWDNIIKPVIDFIVNYFTVVLPGAAMWLWHNVIEPVWQGVANTIEFVWNNLIKPVLDAIVNFFTVILPNAANWLWHNVIEPVWNGIANAIRWVVDNILTPIWEGLKAEWKLLENALNWFWHNVVQPIWQGVANTISWVWNNLIKPVFEGIKSGLHTLGDVFQSVKDAIGRIWNGLGDIAMKPIRFIVNTVLDDGIIRGWNKVVDFLHLGFLHIPEIPRLATGGVFRGVVPGYTPGKDTGLAALGGGEAVMRPEWTRIAGPAYVNAANAASRGGGLGGARSFIASHGLPGFSAGGEIPHFADGGVFGWLGGVAGSIGNFFKGAFNGVMNVAGKVLDFVSNPVESMQNLLNSMITNLNLGGLGDIGKFADFVTQAPKSMIGGLVKKIKEWWDNLMASGGGGGGGGGGPVPDLSGIRGSNRAIVQQIFASMFGWSGSEWDIAQRLIMGESGFNNTAQNPTSTAYGMFQFLNSTWAGYGIGKTSDPRLQAVAGGRYIKARYGSPSKAFAAWSSRSPHWYHGGGIAKLDNGGALPVGLSTVYNGTGKPENVRTAAEADQTNDLLVQLLNAVRAGRVTVPIQIVVDGKVLTQWFQETEIMGGM